MRCAIVGDGLAGLTAYATLRHGGIEAEEIAVLGEDPDPAAAWRVRAAAIRQRRMRSESDGHVAPTAFPGLAVREAARRRRLSPLLRTVADRYNPTVDLFLEHVAEVRERTGWDTSHRSARVERIRPVGEGFELDGHGVFRHLLLAPGHPGLARPEVLAGDRRVIHAYEPHGHEGRVGVVGAGMAAATEWLNALAAGASVVSVRRREPERRPLNLPRPLFTRRGLAAYHATPAPARAGLLRSWLSPSYPPGRRWDEPVDAGRRAGRFSVASIGTNGASAEALLEALDGVDQVVCATGFLRGYRHDPLLARLVTEAGLETYEDWIVLSPDASVPAVTDETRTLALAGVPAQWAFPAADTLAGAKYAARRFLERVRRCPTR